MLNFVLEKNDKIGVTVFVVNVNDDDDDDDDDVIVVVSITVVSSICCSNFFKSYVGSI